MRNKSSSTWLTVLVVVFAAGLFVTVTGWLLASPADDISKAVTSGGKKDAKAADADSFLNAFSSVYVGVDDEKADDYINAAKKLRPDLSDRITAAADVVDNAPEDQEIGGEFRHRVSRHRHRVRICCGMHTLLLSRQKAQYFLATHPTCHAGACHAQQHHHHWRWIQPQEEDGADT